MLSIRKNQWKIFEEVERKKFILRARDYLKRKYPDRTKMIENVELEKLITEGVDAAKSFGIKMEFYVIRFLELQLMLGKKFENLANSKWINDILDDALMLQGEKFQKIDKELESDNSIAAKHYKKYAGT
jgi:hypothetical protein